MTPADLHLLQTPGRPTVHPSGDRCVISLVRPDDALDAYVGQLWEVPLTSGSPRRLTRGFRDTAPRFSPDGRWLAFLRADKGGKPQLHVVEATGGEPVRLTDAPLGAGEPRWAPDSARLAHACRVPEPGRYGTDEDVKAGDEPPRLFTDVRYLEDDLGYWRDRPHQVFVVDLPDLAGNVEPSGAGRQVTSAPQGATSPAWSPDGASLAYVAVDHEGWLQDLRSDAWTVPAEGGSAGRITSTTLSVEQVAWSLDGASLWLLAADYGPDGLDFVAANTGLWSCGLDGSLHRLTSPEADLGEVSGDLGVTPEGVLVQAAVRGAIKLLRVNDSDTVTLIDGPQWVIGADAAAGVVVASVASASSPGEVVHVGVGPLTSFSDFGLPLHELTSPSGVHGWVVLPEGPGPHPVLLDVHGGPHGQYGWKLYDEAQVLASAGYAVLLCNPRGSAGYGVQHGRAVVGAFGGPDVEDVMAFLDAALSSYPLDGDRVGVMGGSYGGWMTAWLLAAFPTRWAAGIVERGFLDPLAFEGTSDIGWFFGDRYLGSDPLAQSPFARVSEVIAPTLVIHSENDLRCPLEQGQRYFAALQKQGTPSAFLVFPGEAHGLTRGGSPRHRRQRFEHVLAWWAEHLPVGS